MYEANAQLRHKILEILHIQRIERHGFHELVKNVAWPDAHLDYAVCLHISKFQNVNNFFHNSFWNVTTCVTVTYKSFLLL